MATNQVIVLEFNELTPSLIDRFVAEGALPNFARLKNESRVFTTMADERAPNLEPWIQWVTVHSGLSYDEHQVFHLNEGHKLKAKRTWEIVSDAGRPVWVCGSMNVPKGNGGTAAVLPDPWCTEVAPAPAELAPYFEFVQRNVLEHTNDRVPVTKADYAKFLWFMARRGLSVATVRTILGQLMDERKADVRWKRVVLLDLLQYDVFASYFRRLNPAFSTFFLNSTAHYQHAYWDSMEPEKFPSTPEAEKHKYRDAIKFGYQRMDGLLARFMKLADASGATLVLCTALSQQPSPDYDQKGGGAFYRPRNFMDFAKAIGISTNFTAQPVMSEQFHLEFSDLPQAAAAESRLKGVTLNGKPMFYVQNHGTRLFAGCGLHDDVPPNSTFVSEGKATPFFDLFYKLDTGKTGVHHPDGILWIRKPDRRHDTFAERVPLTSVAPTLLKLCGVNPPPQMTVAPLPV